MSLRNLATATLFCVMAAASLFIGRAWAQTTINVPADQPTIQAAVNAANNGDTVLVAPGTYVENLNFLGKAITVTSSAGPSVTIIDGGGVDSVVTFDNGESNAAVLNGFTIQNGNAQNWLGSGGGIFVGHASIVFASDPIPNVSPTITGNVIQNNVACGSGGGIESYYASPIIRKNIIQNNTQAAGCIAMNGAGIDLSGTGSAQIDGNTIINNTTVANGGGISLYAAGAPMITNNLIRGNTALGISQPSQGGGIYVVGNSDAVIAVNLIYNNSAGQGGAMFTSSIAAVRGPVVVNNTMFGDSSTSQGSEVYADSYDGKVQFFNNLMIAPAGQTAAYCSAATFTNNDAFSSNGSGLAGPCAFPNSQNGNISVDPLFVNAAAGDFHLTAASPAIDAGNNSPWYFPKTDYDGNFRRIDGNNDCIPVIDIGAYELVRTPNAVLSTYSLSFPTQPVGTSSDPQPITFTNTGDGCFLISQVQITGDFHKSTTCSATGIPGGTSCVYNVVFSPTSAGTRLGNLTIYGGTGANPTVSLSGIGGTSIALSPSNLVFGPQPVGSVSQSQGILITNTGLAYLQMSINVTGPFTVDPPAVALAPGSSFTLSVAFSPMAAGFQPGSLTFVGNATGSVSLSGTGVDFIITASPNVASVKHGQSVQISVTATPVGGPFDYAVNISCNGLPQFAGCVPPSSLVPGSTGATGVLTIMTGTKIKKQDFSIEITAQSGSLFREYPIILSVK